MLKGKYLKVKNMCPVYGMNENVITGVNVTVDVDKRIESQRGPIMARPATLPCRAYQILDIEEYTKNVQDKVFEALNEIRSRKINKEERDLYFKDMASIDLLCHYKGSEFMAMYENYQEGAAQKEREELQKKIKEAKKLLEENGYVVGRSE